MQTCSRCNASSPDTSTTCSNCGVDLKQFSSTNAALKKFVENPRVNAIRINISNDSCPMCYESRGTFEKDKVPALPHEGCSHQNGCRCSYAPVLGEIYP